jgi:dTMP kinase
MSFIVIEGLDGSGKSTQLKLLKEYLSKNNISYKYLHFPRTEEGVFGDLVARFLRGDLGDNDAVNPYLVGLIYAGDRGDAKTEINKWIESGDLVIIDRYIYSNMAFQGAKLKEYEEKLKLREWLINLEYRHYNIPKPDISFFLDVPFSFTTNSLTKEREGEDRDYLNGKKDIHEADLNFQESVRQEYLDLIKTDTDFKLIECFDKKGEMLLPDDIFNKLIGELQQNKVL